jgi:hypothetical protein
MTEEITGYCVRCKAKQQMREPREVVKETKRGSVKFMVGACPACESKGIKTEMWRVCARGAKTT